MAWAAVGLRNHAAASSEGTRCRTPIDSRSGALGARGRACLQVSRHRLSVPKYISFGVCPRNAECGSTWLCSWT